jgi:hypothetical protein
MSYILFPSGCVQPENQNIMYPPTEECRGYREYLQWLDEGNSPIVFNPNEEQ